MVEGSTTSNTTLQRLRCKEEWPNWEAVRSVGVGDILSIDPISSDNPILQMYFRVNTAISRNVRIRIFTKILMSLNMLLL